MTSKKSTSANFSLSKLFSACSLRSIHDHHNAGGSASTLFTGAKIPENDCKCILSPRLRSNLYMNESQK
jgi:hypothetical protein